MQDATVGFRDMVIHMSLIQTTVVMMVLAALAVVPTMWLMLRKTSLFEKAFCVFLMIMILWFQWWLAGI